MEPKELSQALLLPQVTVAILAILGELLAILRSLNEDIRLFVSPDCLYRDLEKFTRELWATLCSIDDTWRRPIVTSDDDDRVTSLSQALAVYKSTPWTSQNQWECDNGGQQVAGVGVCAYEQLGPTGRESH